MTFQTRYGIIGLLALPYQWIFELLSPVIEVLGWISVAAAGMFGALSLPYCVFFLLFGYLFTCLLSVGSILLEEMVYRRYNDVGDLVRLVAACFLEPIGYRPLNTIWRLSGLWHFVTGRNSWQLIQRTGFQSETKVAGTTPG